MKKFIAVFIISMFFSAGVKAQDSFDFSLENTNYEDLLEGVLGIDIPDVSAVSDKNSPKKELKEWTVMFYSNTKDSLCYSQVWQTLEMKKIGSTDKVNVVIETGLPMKDLNGVVSTTTLRMALGEGADSQYIDQHINALLQNGNNVPINYSILNPVKEDIVKQTKNKDMGNWKNIANFTKWAKTNYPAKRYIFIIYGHGSGFFDQRKSLSKGISMDTQTKNYVTLPEFSKLMKATGKVDVLAIQSCLMQMAEVAYQVKDYVDVMVGSSEIMTAFGYDLKGMLDELNANTSISSEKISSILAESYIERAKAFKVKGGHASVISSSKLQGFVDKLNDWVDVTMFVDDRESIVKGIKDVIRFDLFGITLTTSPVIARNFSLSGDLYDFVDIVTKKLPRNTPEQKFAHQKGHDLMNYISRDLVYEYVYTGKSKTEYDFARAHGLAIHIPPKEMIFGSKEIFESRLETLYWDLPFARDTKWGAFLKWVYEEK